MSLGGVRDEAEIRGHRRTYIGSMPGKIIQSMRKAKTSNPLFLLDEIDKMGADFRGDPSSALLEVLDPEQNHTFNDHYLEVDYDLSNVMFITTANTLNIPPPLMDRMEIIRIAGYTEDEKVEIARKHLIPQRGRQAWPRRQGMVDRRRRLLKLLIRRYTREAGVRNLERELSTLARKAVKELTLNKKTKAVKVTEANLPDYLGVPKYRYGEVEEEDQVGVVTGLAWTDVGGELLTIEATHDARQGPHDGDRQPARRDEGVDLGGGILCPLARRSPSASSRRCSTSATSTCTCRKARRPRMDRRRASPW